MLYRLQPIPCLGQIASPGNGAVIAQQHGVIILRVGRDGIRYALRSGQFIMHAGNHAQIDQRFRIDRLIQRQPCDGEGCAQRRVRVAHRLRARIFLIDADVHLYFAGRAGFSRTQHRAVHAHLHQHVLRHKALGNAGGRGPDRVLGNPTADVAIVGGDEVLFIHPAANFDNLPARLGVRWILRCVYQLISPLSMQPSVTV